MKHFFLAIIAFPALCASAEIELPDSLDYTSEFWLRNRLLLFPKGSGRTL